MVLMCHQTGLRRSLHPLVCPVPESPVVLQSNIEPPPPSPHISFLLTGSSSAACLSYRTDLNISARRPSDFSHQPPRSHSANHFRLEEECSSLVLFFPQLFEKYFSLVFLDCWWSFLVNVDFHHHSAGGGVVGVPWWMSTFWRWEVNCNNYGYAKM